MERPLARPYEMRRVGRLEASIAGLAEAQSLLAAFAVAFVYRRRGLEVQIMGVEAQDTQQP